MANLKQGMSGAEVKDLQQKLINAGYNVGSTNADGVFGKNTLAAVKQFQTDNGLAVDGIAGVKTLGALNSIGSNTGNGSQNANAGTQNANAGTGGNTFTTPAGNTYESFTYDDFTYDPYQQSDIVTQAWDTVGQLQANAPGAWSDPYRDQYMGYLNQYENRDPFSYDFNSDALYQQYKDQYIQQGQMAMMDTMGQAAAMTGGYGNSYAQSVGQQAYNQQLNQLNAIMPELYDRAYGIYQQEGQDLLNMYNAYLGLSNQSYNQYLGEVDNYYKQLGAAQDYASTLYNKEYGEWSDKTRMDFDTWSANTNLSFDEWAAKTGILSDENNTLMNQEFQREENKKDRDLQVSENAKSRAAAAAKVEDTGPKYKDLDVGSSAYNTIVSGVKKATTLGELKTLTEQYLALGYDPDQINALTANKAAELSGGSNTLEPWEIKLLQGAAVAPRQSGSLGRYTY